MGAKEFQAALNDSPALPAVERTLLGESRNALSRNCETRTLCESPMARWCKTRTFCESPFGRAVRLNCDGTTNVAVPPPSGTIGSALGHQFAAYLTGAEAFYNGDYDLARQSFTSLRDSSQPWLKQTSRYMLGRVELNRAQATAFGDYG